MTFGQNVRSYRKKHGFTQQKLAEKCGVSLRSIQNYETDTRVPNSLAIVKKLAAALDTTYDVLLDEKSRLVAEAQTIGGSSAARDINTILSDVNCLFAGGDVSEDDKDKVMRAITDMYWAAKEKNQKYSSK